jgi:hypothetical protein
MRWAAVTDSTHTPPRGESKSPRFKEGDYVRHKDSGWAGTVLWVFADDGGMGQGLRVMVRPTYPRPKRYLRNSCRVGDEWKGWNPITVTEDELEARE